MARVVLKSAGFREMLNSSGVRNMLTRRMGAVESAAISGAPYDEGDYAGSIHIEQATTDRAVVRVVARAPHAMFVEAMTGNLARALDASGGESSGGVQKFSYTTKDGRTIQATQAQIDNWTRGSG